MPEDSEGVTLADKALSAAGRGAAAVASGTKKALDAATDKISKTSGTKLLSIMRLLNIILAVAVLGILIGGYFLGQVGSGLSNLFMAVYGIASAVVLLFFEFGAIKIDAFLRKYFGFIYTYIGRTFFNFFMIAMSMTKTPSGNYWWAQWVLIVAGVLTTIFNIFVICKHPDFQKGGDLYGTDLTDTQGVEPPAAAEPTVRASAAKKPTGAVYESNPFESSDDDDIHAASVSTGKGGKSTPAKKTPQSPPVPKKDAKGKGKPKEDNPFEDDNPFA